ncbi:MAG: tetratricopeptide repeat protein [Bacteroidia bacterium]
MNTPLFKIIAFLIVTTSTWCYSQEIISFPQEGNSVNKSSEEQLAAQYFQNKEYEKAAFYYEKLFEKNPIDRYYQNLLTCLIETENFNKAEKLVKKQQKKNPYALNYTVDLGYVYKREGKMDEAKKVWEKAINELAPNQNQIFELAHAFNNRKETDFALSTYLKGRKILNGLYTFHFEIADIYAQKGNYAAMINEYLDVLLINEAYIQQVQNALLRIYQSAPEDKKNETLKTELLKRIQKYPDKKIFAEMLIWIMMQEQDFNGALTQSIALDKRLKEDGARVFSLAHMAADNKQYEASAKGYQYIIDKGKENYYYTSAKIELLHVNFKKITEQAKYTKEELIQLEKNYVTTLNELGKSGNTASLMRDLAHLYAFYLHEIDKAIAILDEIVAMGRISPQLKAECKLDLGDILLLENDIWEASLLYSQVEKDFKHDELGDKAKFKNARLSYFVGDFKWAQAQLDVLKGSTSKLIANDAMQLSLLITDNTTIDTNEVPLQIYARAELLMFQNKLEEALKTLDTINLYFPGHSLTDDILMSKARIFEKNQDFENALKMYEAIYNGFADDIYGDDALFKMAEIEHFIFNKPETAKALYQKVLMEFPGSIFVVESRKRIRQIRGDNLN